MLIRKRSFLQRVVVECIYQGWLGGAILWSAARARTSSGLQRRIMNAVTCVHTGVHSTESTL